MMKLFCCVSLCLATISAYSLQQDDTGDMMAPAEHTQIRGNPDDARHRVLDSASLAALVRYVNSAPGINTIKGRPDQVSQTGRTPYSARHSLGRYASSSPAGSLPESSCVGTTSLVMSLFKDALHQRGLPAEDVENLMVEVLQGLSSQIAPAARPEDDLPLPVKRGYSGRGSLHIRFSPRFGTKLVPNQKMGEGGSTLLRYGRSAEAVDNSKQ